MIAMIGPEPNLLGDVTELAFSTVTHFMISFYLSSSHSLPTPIQLGGTTKLLLIMLHKSKSPSAIRRLHYLLGLDALRSRAQISLRNI